MTSKNNLQLLLIEDNPGDARLIAELLHEHASQHPNLPTYKISHLKTLETGLAHLADNQVDVILLDLNLSDAGGLNTFVAVNHTAPEIPVIILTGIGDVQLAGQAMQAGAQDYLDKDQLTPYLLDRAIRYAMERQQLRSALQHSETRLRTLIEQNADGILMTDANGTVFYANKMAEQMLDTTIDELHQKPLGFPLENGSSIKLNTFLADAPDIRRVAEMRLAKIEWHGNTRYITTLRDITERTIAEQALKNSEEKYRTLIERSLQGVVIIQQSRPVFANPAFTKISGYSIPEILTMEADDLISIVHPGDREAVVGYFQNQQTHDMPYTPLKFRLLQKSGEVCWLETQATDIEHNHSPATLLLLINITDKKIAEDRLTKERNLLRTIIDNLPDDIFVKDLSGKFVTANQAALQSLGAKNLLDVIGKTDMDFMDATTAHKAFAAELELFSTGIPIINQEEQIPHQEQNQNRWVLSTKVPLRDADTQIIGLVGIRRDVSERRIAEETLKQEHDLLAQRVEERTAELQKANLQLSQALRVKDEFMASMSHELRTPLNAILGMSEILREGVYGVLNDQQLNSVNIVQESGRHLLALINDILDVSRIEADKLDLKISSVSVDSACEASLRFIQRAAEKKGIKISVEYRQNHLVLLADERRLKQILVNLLNNAVKFTPNNGSVGLIVSVSEPDQQLTFTVWDTGIGIAPPDISRIFKPFVQLDSRLAREYEGSGLGLTLVNLLTEMHHGHITVESEPGHGSRFMVTFPWHNTFEQTEPQPDTTPTRYLKSQSNQEHPLLLLAEDNLANVEVMSSYLSARGYRVVSVHDGAEALKYANKLHPDLIIMDIHMPEMDGLEATEIIRNTESLAQIPIIALTALAMPGDKERCLAAGVNDYLSKPVSLHRLTEAIEYNLKLQHSPDSDAD